MRDLITKSDFTLARTCDAKLFFRLNGYAQNDANDEYLRLLAEGGYMVQALVESRKPAGVLARDPATVAELLRRDRVTLFEVTLQSGRRQARIDVLEKTGTRVRLIEVKSKSFDGAEHLARLAAGEPGIFRWKKRPEEIISEWTRTLEDLTYQVLVAERALPSLVIEPWLALVDKSKRVDLDNAPRLFDLHRAIAQDGSRRVYRAIFRRPDLLEACDLVTEVDVSAEVALLRDEVEREATRFENLVGHPLEASPARLGAKCKDCEFNLDEDTEDGFSECWGCLAAVSPHVLELINVSQVKVDGTPLVESLVRSGRASLFDVPESALTRRDGSVGPQAERQRRQIQCARAGTPWVGPGLRTSLASVDYPLSFIDFEVSRLAIPPHRGMRPYGPVMFQWSCQRVASPGDRPEGREWLNIDDAWPNREFARTLREAVGDQGSVLTWSRYEENLLLEFASEFRRFGEDAPDLARWIDDLAARRIVDMHEWARNDYYHPRMKGRTSIKMVLDALWATDELMRERYQAWGGVGRPGDVDPYQALPKLEINGIPQNVRNGTGAVRAYEAMMYGLEKDDQATRAAWRSLLLQYCALDTLGMVLIFDHWRRLTASG